MDKSKKDYSLGIIYANGKVEGEDFVVYLEDEELAFKVKSFLDEEEIEFEKEAQRTVIRDDKFNKYLKNITDEDVNVRLINSRDFVRGFLETRGEIYLDDDSWTFEIKGEREDIIFISEFLNDEVGAKMTSVVQRGKLKIGLSVIRVYKIYTKSRSNIRKIVDYFNDENTSARMKNAFMEFVRYDETRPTHMTKKAYKNYKNATLAMANHLGIDIRGIRGAGNRKQSVFLWEGDEQKSGFGGWYEAYEWVSEEYKKKGLEPLEVKVPLNKDTKDAINSVIRNIEKHDGSVADLKHKVLLKLKSII